MNETTRPIIRIHDQETDEIVDREMNDDEFAAWETQQAAQAQAQAEAEAQATAKAEAETKLAALGLTADDLKALLG